MDTQNHTAHTIFGERSSVDPGNVQQKVGNNHRRRGIFSVFIKLVLPVTFLNRDCGLILICWTDFNLCR